MAYIKKTEKVICKLKITYFVNQRQCKNILVGLSGGLR